MSGITEQELLSEAPDAEDSDELADSNPWLTVALFAVAVVLGGGCLLLQFLWS